MAVDNACFNHLPSLNFEVRRRQTFSFSINRPGDFLTSNLVRVIARGVVNFLTNFGVSRTFRSRLMDQHLSDGPHDLATLAFNLGGRGACR